MADAVLLAWRLIMGAVSAVAMTMHLSMAMAADDRVRSWVSPDGKVTLSSVKMGGGDDLGYRLLLSRAGRAPVVVDTYMRDVDLLWSPDSKAVAITDWIGSNVADCYVVKVATPQARISVTDRLPKLREAANSHFYVSCDRWLSAKRLAVQVKGHTDETPFYEFCYRFLLDMSTMRVRRR